MSSTILAWARRSPGAETGGMGFTLGHIEKNWIGLLGAGGALETQPASPANTHVPMSRQLWISLFIS